MSPKVDPRTIRVNDQAANPHLSVRCCDLTSTKNDKKHIMYEVLAVASTVSLCFWVFDHPVAGLAGIAFRVENVNFRVASAQFY